MKHPRAIDSSLHPAVIPAAVIAAGLIAPLPAWTAPGDLDPGFGDVGRVELDLYGSRLVDRSRGGRLSADRRRSPRAATSTASMPPISTRGCWTTDRSTQRIPRPSPKVYWAYDSVLQPDGKRVTVGENGASGDTDLVVYRLLTDGSLDPDFGVDGMTTVVRCRRLRAVGPHGSSSSPTVRSSWRASSVSTGWSSYACCPTVRSTASFGTERRLHHRCDDHDRYPARSPTVVWRQLSAHRPGRERRAVDLQCPRADVHRSHRFDLWRRRVGGGRHRRGRIVVLQLTGRR